MPSLVGWSAACPKYLTLDTVNPRGLAPILFPLRSLLSFCRRNSEVGRIEELPILSWLPPPSTVDLTLVSLSPPLSFFVKAKFFANYWIETSLLYGSYKQDYIEFFREQCYFKSVIFFSPLNVLALSQLNMGSNSSVNDGKKRC